MPVRRLLPLALALVCLAPATARGQDLQGQEIRGEVRATDVNVAVPGAQVSLLGPDGRARGRASSDADGRFTFQGLAEGAYVISVQAPGFAHGVDQHLTLRDGVSADVTVWLDPLPISLPGLQVQARRRDDAFIRRAIGLDPRSLDPGDLALGAYLRQLEQGSYTLADVIRKQAVPGLVVERGTTGICRSANGCNKGPCFRLRALDCALVFLDDVPVDRDKVWTIDVTDVAAVVVLHGNQAGPIFGTGSWGGVVLVYTYEGMNLPRPPGG